MTNMTNEKRKIAQRKVVNGKFEFAKNNKVQQSFGQFTKTC